MDLIEQARRLIKAWDDWEGAVILDQASWSERGGFRVTGTHYDRYIALQDQRRAMREALVTSAATHTTLNSIGGAIHGD